MESDKKEVKVVSNDRLKEIDRAEEPGVHHHPVSLVNDEADVVFEYPMPSAPAAAPIYQSMPSAAERYYTHPSPIVSCAAAVATSSAEIAEI